MTFLGHSSGETGVPKSASSGPVAATPSHAMHSSSLRRLTPNQSGSVSAAPPPLSSRRPDHKELRSAVKGPRGDAQRMWLAVWGLLLGDVFVDCDVL
ncbi:hypothetical protein O3P69_020716 [Scylla paramamosain]|uniref:Uncharacterized protein n=1 Tax=Scylla paramamosain TaxID=85552 RepID=A0AAW0TMD8_SCYPA